MEPERWQEVQRLFESALEKSPEELPGWLDTVEDPSLRAEVEALLAADADAGNFIEEAVGDGARRLAGEDEGSPPPRFGKYEVEGQIGEGGFGIVYRGRDPMLGRSVAIKTCTASDGNRRRRFLREGRLAAGLQHANVTTVHDLGEEDGIPYLVQELLPGEDLRDVIARGEPLPLLTKLDYLVQIARGLEYAHGRGVLHRDVKPANVRVLSHGAIKIMDFGIAKAVDGHSRLTAPGAAIGTVGYLAPEQLRGEEVDARADVFAFGVLAYELCAGTRPFEGEDFSSISHQLLNVDPPTLAETRPPLPPELAAVVTRCLAKEPDRRYPSFTEVLEELEPLLRTARVEASASSMRTLELPVAALPEPDPDQRREHSQWLRATMLAAAVVGTLASVWWWQANRNAALPPASVPMEARDTATDSAEPSVVALAEAQTTLPAVTEEPPRSAAEEEFPSQDRNRPRIEPPINKPAPRATGPTTASALPDDPLPPKPTELPASPPVAQTMTPSVREEPSVTAPQPVQEIPSAPPPEELAVERVRPGVLLHPDSDAVAPRLLAHPQPAYPERARRRRKEARVTVRVLVDENGRVVQAATSGDDPWGFAEAAERAALEATFQPAVQDDVAGKMWTEIVFEFKLP